MVARKEIQWRGPVFPDTQRTPVYAQPWVNVQELADAFLVQVAAPGLEKQDFSIEVKDQTLLITVEKGHEEKSYVRQEFDFSRFKRVFYLPKGSDREKITAEYEAGILAIRIPKQPEIQHRVVVK